MTITDETYYAMTKKRANLRQAANKLSTERQQNEKASFYEKEYKKLQRKWDKRTDGHEIILRAVGEAMKNWTDLDIPKPKPDRRRTVPEEVAIMHMSDVHVGKVTESFNSTVAYERVMSFVNKSIQIAEMRRSVARIDECRLYNTGDFVEGEIVFAHQPHLIDQPTIDQCTETGPSILVAAISKLMEHFKRVRVISVPGNHGKTGNKNSTAHPRSNWDTVCNKIAKIRLLGCDINPRKKYQDRLEFNVSDTWYAVDHVYGWGNLLFHGHQIRGGFAGMPWYGIGKKLAGWIDSINLPWDYIFFGHFHTYTSGTINKRVFLANGTCESDNVYAQENMAACGDPVQRLCFFNEKLGLISDSPIYLAERAPSSLRG